MNFDEVICPWIFWTKSLPWRTLHRTQFEAHERSTRPLTGRLWLATENPRRPAARSLPPHEMQLGDDQWRCLHPQPPAEAAVGAAAKLSIGRICPPPPPPTRSANADLSRLPPLFIYSSPFFWDCASRIAVDWLLLDVPHCHLAASIFSWNE